MNNHDYARRSRTYDSNPPRTIEIPNTGYDLLLYEGRDALGTPYFHWKLSRPGKDGRYLTTNRVGQVFAYLRAFTAMTGGLAKLERLDNGLREHLTSLTNSLRAIPIPIVGEPQGFPTEAANSVDRAFAV